MNGQLPFEGDTFIPIEIISLKEKFSLKNFIETGTQYGATTESLCNIFEGGNNVTIEGENTYLNIALERLEHHKINAIHGLSQNVLKTLEIFNDTLFYLDAHGCEIGGCPLKEELKIITSKKLKNICIVIHDFRVPNHPELGFDAYDYELCIEEIESYLKGFEYHYNNEANGAMRGIIYCYPKK